MRKQNFLLAVVLVLFVIGCAKKEPEVIKIGAIAPLTGDNAVYGKALKLGMDLALEEHSLRAGKEESKLEIIYEDDKAIAQNGVNAFQKLVSVNKVPMVIGAMFSAVTLAIAPIAENQHIVLLSPTSSAVELSKAGDYIFRIYPSDSYDGTYLADFSLSILKAKIAAIVYIQVASTVAISDVFQNVFESKGGKIVSKEGYKEGESNFRAILSKLKTIKPEIVFLPGYLKEMALILRQARELGLDSKFVSISTFNDPQILQLAGEAAEGVIFSTPYYDPDSPDSLVSHFVQSFKKKYSDTPNIWAGYGYDVVRVAAEAIAKSDKTSDGIKKALYLINHFPGVTGSVTFDTNGDVQKDLKIMNVKNQKFVPFKDNVPGNQ